MPTEIPPPIQANAQEEATITETIALQQKVHSGASWFDWIAGFTVLNSLISLFGKNTHFGSGMGITTLVDRFARKLAPEVGPSISLCIAVCCAAGLFGLGVLAKRKHWWAFAAGIAILLFDTFLIFLVGKGFFFSIFLHIWATISMISGLNALKKLGAW